jgi:hypothetical protein
MSDNVRPDENGGPSTEWAPPPPPIDPYPATPRPDQDATTDPTASFADKLPTAPAMVAAIRAGALSTIVSIGVATVCGYLALSLAKSTATDFGGLAPDGFRLGLWLFAACFGSPLTGHFSEDADTGLGQVSLAVHVPLALQLAVSLGLVGYLSWRAERARPSTGRAGLTVAALCTAVVTAVFAFIAAKASPLSGSAHTEELSATGRLGIAAVRAGVSTLLLAFLAAFLARSILADRLTLFSISRPLRRAVEPPLRMAATYLLVATTVGSGYALITLMLSGGPIGGSLGLWAVEQPLLGLAAAQFGSMVPLKWSVIGFDGLDGRSESLLSHDVSAWYLLYLLIPLIAMLLAGVRFTLNRISGTSPPWRDAAMTGAALALVIALVDWYFRVRVTQTRVGSVLNLYVDAAAESTGGFDGFVAILPAFVTGALIPILGWWLTPLLVARAPGFANWLTAGSVNHTRSVIDDELEQPVYPTSARASQFLAGLGAHYGRPVTEPLPSTQTESTSTQPEYAGTQHPSTLRAAAPFRRRWKAVLLAVATFMVLVVGGRITVGYLDAHRYGPDKTVGAFLAAIQHGHASKALSYAQHPPTGPLLTDAVPRQENSGGGISHIRVGTPAVKGATATVRFTYLIAGRETTDQLELVKAGHTTGVFDAWKIVNPTATLQLLDDSAGLVTSFTLNGVSVDPSQPLSVFPGTLTTGGGSQWYDAHADRSVVTYFNVPTVFSVSAELNPAAQSAAELLITKSVEDCIKSTDFAPSGCPFSTIDYGFNAVAPKVTWSLTSPISIAAVDMSTPGLIRCTVSVPAHYSYTDPAKTGFFESPATRHSDDVPSYERTKTALIDLTGTSPTLSWGY